MFAKTKDVLNRFFGRGLIPHQLAFTLLNPLRRFVLAPEALAARLDLAADHRVLEVGPGPGYCSLAVARRIPQGTLYLVDIQEEMLRKAEARLRRAGLENVSIHHGDAAALPFSAGCFDVVFMVAVFGEIRQQSAAMSECLRVLKPGGLLSVTEQPGDTDFVDLGDLKERVQAEGFVLATVHGGNKNFTANFHKPD